jgi:accessory gene regulator protein AgrB
VTISFAAGLYYISEIVEEYTEKAKKVIKVITFATILLYILLLIEENFSITIIACGLLAQVVHLLILINFPNIKILSIEFW